VFSQREKGGNRGEQERDGERRGNEKYREKERGRKTGDAKHVVFHKKGSGGGKENQNTKNNPEKNHFF